MVRTRKTRGLNRRDPLWICVAAGVSAVALVTMVVLFTTRTVHADASLPRATINSPLTGTASGATPASLALAKLATPKNVPTPEAQRWTDKIHGIASWYGGVF